MIKINVSICYFVCQLFLFFICLLIFLSFFFGVCGGGGRVGVGWSVVLVLFSFGVFERLAFIK